MPPPLAVIVIVRLPRVARDPTLTVIVEVPAPGAGIELWVKVTVVPLPCPEADKVIPEEKLPEIVVVMAALPEPPRITLIVVGDTLSEKLGTTWVTVNMTVVLPVNGEEVPVTVMG